MSPVCLVALSDEGARYVETFTRIEVLMSESDLAYLFAKSVDLSGDVYCHLVVTQEDRKGEPMDVDVVLPHRFIHGVFKSVEELKPLPPKRRAGFT